MESMDIWLQKVRSWRVIDAKDSTQPSLKEQVKLVACPRFEPSLRVDGRQAESVAIHRPRLCSGRCCCWLPVSVGFPDCLADLALGILVGL